MPTQLRADFLGRVIRTAGGIGTGDHRAQVRFPCPASPKTANVGEGRRSHRSRWQAVNAGSSRLRGIASRFVQNRIRDAARRRRRCTRSPKNCRIQPQKPAGGAGRRAAGGGLGPGRTRPRRPDVAERLSMITYKWLQSYVRQSSFYPVSHNLESQYLQYVMEERLWQLSCGGTDKHSARPTSGTRRRRVPKQAMEFIH